MSLFDAFPPKPKGMWWKTYERLENQYARADMNASALLGDVLARLNRFR